MTYEQAVAYVGDLRPDGLVIKLKADGHDHPAFLAEALEINQEGGVDEVAHRVFHQVQGDICDACQLWPVDHHVEPGIDLCDDCFATYYSMEDDF